MGLNFVDSIIIYNEYQSRTQGQLYFGTRFDNVRIELTQAANQKASGLENASVCVVKIPTPTPKLYETFEVWRKLATEEMLQKFTLNKGKDFFVVVKKADLNIDIDSLPVGMVESDEYAEGWLDYVKNKYGYAFKIDTVDVYTLIPRFEIGGK